MSYADHKSRQKIHQRGFSLVELIIFIVIIALLSTGLLAYFSEALLGSATPANMVTATQVAQERMELILAQKKTLGYAAFTPDPGGSFDPCKIPPPPPFPPQCTTPGYTVISRLDVDTPSVGYKTVTVTVTGPSDASLTALVADY